MSGTHAVTGYRTGFLPDGRRGRGLTGPMRGRGRVVPTNRSSPVANGSQLGWHAMPARRDLRSVAQHVQGTGPVNPLVHIDNRGLYTPHAGENTGPGPGPAPFQPTPHPLPETPLPARNTPPLPHPIWTNGPPTAAQTNGLPLTVSANCAYTNRHARSRYTRQGTKEPSPRPGRADVGAPRGARHRPEGQEGVAA